MTEEVSPQNNIDVVSLASEILVAYVSNNSVPRAELPALIADVHAAIERLVPAEAEEPQAAPVPAVPVRKSVTNDHIVCLEDGKTFKSLKRHLSTHHGMTPDEYRAKWNLPHDYPMVAPAYAEARSALARSMGLGRKRGAKAAAAEETPKPTRAPRKAAAADSAPTRRKKAGT